MTSVIAAIAVVIRFVCAVASSRMGYLSSKSVKKTLRKMIYRKLLRFGTSYKEQANTSEVECNDFRVLEFVAHRISGHR